MDLSELFLSCKQPYDLKSANGLEALRKQVVFLTGQIFDSKCQEHSKAIAYLAHAAHFTNFLGNPEDFKNGYISASIEFIRRANPPVNYLIGDTGFDMAAYLRNWLYHDVDKQFMNRFLSGLESSMPEIVKKSEEYAKSLKRMIENERARGVSFNHSKHCI